MAISVMYPAMPGSPKTTLTADITASDTSLTVADGNALPVAPNILVVGNEENAEVICYNAKSGNTVSGLIRALGRTVASAWTAGTEVARNFTSFDHDRFKENIEDLATNKADVTDVYTQTETDTLLNAKQNTLTFDNSPTASSSNPVKSSGIKTALDGKANSSHTHGNISNVGAITTTTALASGDRIVITDSSDSSKAKGTTITFDGSTTTQALSRKGTWESFATSSHTHDDRYYTESEVNTLLGGKQDTLENSGWVSVTTTNCSAGSIHYRKIGSVVQVVGTGIKLSSALGSGENVTVGTLPSTVRPQTYNAFSFGCAGTQNPMFVNLQTDGAIRFYTPSYVNTISTNVVCYFNTTFLVG